VEVSDAELVRLDVEDRVAVLTLNRPEKLNALSLELRARFDELVDQVRADEGIRAVVLTGAGRAFCAGADLGGGGPPDGTLAVHRVFEEAADRQLRLRELPQPVIAAVHGYCLGRGLELALWCDIVVASAGARFGEPEVRDGSFVASIIPWLTNAQQAKLLMLTGDTIPAEEAHRLGLVAQVVEDGTALAAALALARRLTHLPVPAAREVKRYVNAVQDLAGLLAMQRHGTTTSVLLHSLSPAELGVAELVELRRREGLKAYLAARDAPFVS
jgi:enoyl-CoA hydratase/carnithine racemase